MKAGFLKARAYAAFGSDNRWTDVERIARAVGNGARCRRERRTSPMGRHIHIIQYIHHGFGEWISRSRGAIGDISALSTISVLPVPNSSPEKEDAAGAVRPLLLSMTNILDKMD
jgi:hypothetical protein